MRFKDFYLKENRSVPFKVSLGAGGKRWGFKNSETNKMNYVKFKDLDPYNSMMRFLHEIEATKTEEADSTIDYNDLARNIINNKVDNVYIKSGKFEQIKKAWNLD